MSLIVLWCLLFLFKSALCYWIYFKDGADKIEDWFHPFLLSVFGTQWNADHIRLYTMLIWVVIVCVFIAGLFSEPLRAYYVGDKTKRYASSKQALLFHVPALPRPVTLVAQTPHSLAG